MLLGVRLGPEKVIRCCSHLLGFTDPALRTVCSVLPASSCSAIDPAVVARFYFLATVVFRSVLRTAQKSHIFGSYLEISTFQIYFTKSKT